MVMKSSLVQEHTQELVVWLSIQWENAYGFTVVMVQKSLLLMEKVCAVAFNAQAEKQMKQFLKG